MARVVPVRDAEEDLLEHETLQSARRAEIWFGRLEPRQRRLCMTSIAAGGVVEKDVKAVVERLTQGTTFGSPVGLVLSGAPGVGKTTIALTVATSAVLKGILSPSEARFIRMDELLDRAVHALPSERSRVVDDALDRVRLVILDDLGRVGGAHPDVARRLTDSIVDRLWRQDVTVLATTNLDVSALRTALGDASFGRLIDDTPRRDVTVVNGPDWRTV